MTRTDLSYIAYYNAVLRTIETSDEQAPHCRNPAVLPLFSGAAARIGSAQRLC